VTGRLQQTVRRAGAAVVARREAVSRPQRAVRAEVVRAVDVTPTMRRVTLTGPELSAFPVLGGDHYARLLLPRAGQVEPLLPTTSRWYPELLAMDAAQRPVLRNYTLRAVRPEQQQVDIDLVVHAHAGPGGRWARDAAPGDVVGLIEQGVLFTPDLTAEHLLLVTDDTGLPALAGLLAQWSGDVTAVVEVSGPADEQDLARPVTWLHRGDDVPGRLALRHVPGLPPLTVGRGQAWLAGEAAMVTGLRRHLVRERGYAKSDISFTGYFRHGRAQYAD
jgi:NADPH-dependent ferric siderophore reductase